MLKASSMQANISAFAGRSNMPPTAWARNRALGFAAAWGELATCIYSQDDRELCDPDNRAAMVEATTKFFGFAKQMETSKPPATAEEARFIGNFREANPRYLQEALIVDPALLVVGRKDR